MKIINNRLKKELYYRLPVYEIEIDFGPRKRKMYWNIVELLVYRVKNPFSKKIKTYKEIHLLLRDNLNKLDYKAMSKELGEKVDINTVNFLIGQIIADVKKKSKKTKEQKTR